MNLFIWPNALQFNFVIFFFDPAKIYIYLVEIEHATL